MPAGKQEYGSVIKVSGKHQNNLKLDGLYKLVFAYHFIEILHVVSKPVCIYICMP